MNNALVLKLENISYAYNTNNRIQDVSFEVHRGEVLGLLGVNGAGKSSILKVIAGLLPKHSGAVHILNQPFDTHSNELRRYIGYLPEQSALYTNATVDEFLKYRGQLYGLSATAIKTNLDRVKERCGLSKVAKRLIKTLSKGYRQRIGIAQAILHSPALLLLDEPTDGLDPIQIIEIRRLIKELGREMAILFSTHILPEIEACCSGAVIMHQGKIIYQGSLQALRTTVDCCHLMVRFKTIVPRDALSDLDGIDQINAVSPQQYILICRDRSIATQAVMAAAIRERWELEEIRHYEAPLEQLFTQLVQRKCA